MAKNPILPFLAVIISLFFNITVADHLSICPYSSRLEKKTKDKMSQNLKHSYIMISNWYSPRVTIVCLPLCIHLCLAAINSIWCCDSAPLSIHFNGNDVHCRIAGNLHYVSNMGCSELLLMMCVQ